MFVVVISNTLAMSSTLQPLMYDTERSSLLFAIDETEVFDNFSLESIEDMLNGWAEDVSLIDALGNLEQVGDKRRITSALLRNEIREGVNKFSLAIRNIVKNLSEKIGTEQAASSIRSHARVFANEWDYFCEYIFSLQSRAREQIESVIREQPQIESTDDCN